MAKSKSVRKRRRGGRKRLTDVPRLRDGRIDQARRIIPPTLEMIEKRALLSGRHQEILDLTEQLREGVITDRDFKDAYRKFKTSVGSDPRAELCNVLGVLELRGHITPSQRKAGAHLAQLHRRLNRLLQVPSGMPKISRLDRMPPGKESLQENEEKARDALENAQLKFRECHDVLWSAGNQVSSEVIKVAIQGEYPTWFGLDDLFPGGARARRDLQTGLATLAEHFGFSATEAA